MPIPSIVSRTSVDLFEHLFIAGDDRNNSACFSDEFVRRFGLQNPQQVVEYLKSAEGKTTLALISQELMAIEELNQHKIEQYQKSLALENHLKFLLMGLMADKQSLAEQVTYITQQQIDKKLKETEKSQSKKSKLDISIAIAACEANIEAYTQALGALDKKHGQLQQQLTAIDSELLQLEDEAFFMNEIHEHLSLCMEQLHVDMANEPSKDDSNQHVDPLEQQNGNADAQTDEMAICRIESRLQHIHQRINKCEHLHNTNPSVQLLHELEGLKLRKQGLLQKLQVLKKEKILLNASLEEVHDFKDAHFIVSPSHKPRYQKRGDCYGICTENMNTEKLNEEDWLQAQDNHEQLKHEVRVVFVHYHERIKQDIKQHSERKQYCEGLKNEFISQIAKVEMSKANVLQGLLSNKAQKAALNTMRPEPKSEQGNSKEKNLSFLRPHCSHSSIRRHLEEKRPTIPRKPFVLEKKRKESNQLPPAPDEILSSDAKYRCPHEVQNTMEPEFILTPPKL